MQKQKPSLQYCKDDFFIILINKFMAVLFHRLNRKYCPLHN